MWLIFREIQRERACVYMQLRGWQFSISMDVTCWTAFTLLTSAAAMIICASSMLSWSCTLNTMRGFVLRRVNGSSAFFPLFLLTSSCKNLSWLQKDAQEEIYIYKCNKWRLMAYVHIAHNNRNNSADKNSSISYLLVSRPGHCPSCVHA